MAGLEIEYKAAKKAAKGFLDAESRAHDALHVALANAYEFYVAGRAKPAYMEEILSQAGLSETNLSPASNQVVKLLFYPEKSAQSQKRQTISKWAIVLRECELAGVKPKDAKKHIARHTIDGLVEENRQRQLLSGTPSAGKAMTKFDQGKQIATGLQSLADFQHDGSYSDGLGLALIEIDGGVAKVRRVVADESSATTQKIVRDLVTKVPRKVTDFLPVGVLCRAANSFLRGGNTLAAIISSGESGTSVRLATSGTLKTGVVRGFFAKIDDLPEGEYYLDGEALQKMRKLLPKHRYRNWTVSPIAGGISVKVDTDPVEEVSFLKCDEQLTLASFFSAANTPDLEIKLDDGLLQSLAEKEASFNAAKAGTVAHEVSAKVWIMKDVHGNLTERISMPAKASVLGSTKVTIELGDDTLKRIARAAKIFPRIYKNAETSLLLGNGYLALVVCDPYASRWEMIVPRQKDREHDPALMTNDEVDMSPLSGTV